MINNSGQKKRKLAQTSISSLFPPTSSKKLKLNEGPVLAKDLEEEKESVSSKMIKSSDSSP